MKNLFFLLIYIIIIPSCIGHVKRKSTDSCTNYKVDSVFNSGFNSLDSLIKLNNSSPHHKIDLNTRVFINSVSLISGINYFSHDYSGTPQFRELEVNKWKEWYSINNCKIPWRETKEVLTLFKSQFLTDEDLLALEQLQRDFEIMFETPQ